MVRLRQAGLAALAGVAAFMAATLVLPLDTVGDPAFDIPHLRARWYDETWVWLLHLAGAALAAVVALGRRSLWAALAAVLALAGVLLMVTEYDRFIRYGDLILPHDAAMPRLWLSRAGTLALALASLAALALAGRRAGRVTRALP